MRNSTIVDIGLELWKWRRRRVRGRKLRGGGRGGDVELERGSFEVVEVAET